VLTFQFSLMMVTTSSMWTNCCIGGAGYIFWVGEDFSVRELQHFYSYCQPRC